MESDSRVSESVCLWITGAGRLANPASTCRLNRHRTGYALREPVHDQLLATRPTQERQAGDACLPFRFSGLGTR